MSGFINSLDGSKLAIILSFILALGALIFIGWHLIAIDGPDAIPEIQFMEQVVQAALIAGGGISTVHVITGAVVASKTKNQAAAQPDQKAA